ncbi:uncharacterized protein LOC121383960 [Gigantopelta aegis]|uniref:uncharacterized protein LOC121383960 n=1 Tax=Gigantopelta aegis TaxID=1735272 RepID=UPI001B889515|nr:uncharacterized protein LOC121383960 [Gigantopelta aegis]XP_041370020.1 uncharacterized protein LOC121383960 [Gigantopelta aegis]
MKKFHLFFLLLTTTLFLSCMFGYGLFRQHTVVSDHWEPFSRKMNERDLSVTEMILQRFAATMEAARVTYFLYAGSLLGSYRHHGIVPWDDDVDVLVPFGQQKALHLALSGQEPFFFLDTSMRIRWKFYSSHCESIKTKSWKWPFLDISFYKENDTHIWDSDPDSTKSTLYNKSIVFPLRKGIFMNLSLPVPRDPYAVLSVDMDVKMCESNSYDHRREESIPDIYRKSVPCSELQNIFQFVKHETNETL